MLARRVRLHGSIACCWLCGTHADFCCLLLAGSLARLVSELIYIPVYDLALPEDGVLAVLELVVSTHAQEDQIVGNIISYVSNILDELQVRFDAAREQRRRSARFMVFARAKAGYASISCREPCLAARTRALRDALMLHMHALPVHEAALPAAQSAVHRITPPQPACLLSCARCCQCGA